VDDEAIRIMSRRDGEALGFLILLMIYVVHSIVMYACDKFWALHRFMLDFYFQNGDFSLWMIIAIITVCFWYLCYWLGSKKKSKLEAKAKLEAITEVKSEPTSTAHPGEHISVLKNYTSALKTAPEIIHKPETKKETCKPANEATSAHPTYSPSKLEATSTAHPGEHISVLKNYTSALKTAPEIIHKPETKKETCKPANKATSAHPTYSQIPVPDVKAVSISKIELTPWEEANVVSNKVLETPPAFAIWAQLQREGIAVPKKQVDDRLWFVTQVVRMPESEAILGTLNYFRRYMPPKENAATAQIESQKPDFYSSIEWFTLARQIRERDGFTCQQCGKHGPNDHVSLHVHHKIPRGNGGSDDPSNLITLCANCHARQPFHNTRLSRN